MGIINTISATHEPYFVEVDVNGCERCGRGKTWTVVGPDGVACGTSWEDWGEAKLYADSMNAAFSAGRPESVWVTKISNYNLVVGIYWTKAEAVAEAERDQRLSVQEWVVSR